MGQVVSCESALIVGGWLAMSMEVQGAAEYIRQFKFVKWVIYIPLI
jgi:hypothetical protein